MISLIRRRELLDKLIEVSQLLEPLVDKNVLSRQQADHFVFGYLYQSEFNQEECQWLLSQIGIPSEEEDELAVNQLLSKIIELLIKIGSIHKERVYLKLHPELEGDILDVDGEVLACFDSFEDCAVKMQDFIKNNDQSNLTNDEYAVIAAIRAEPNYQVKQEEKKLAYSMVSRNLLEQVGEYTFSVTEYGTHLFKQVP